VLALNSQKQLFFDLLCRWNAAYNLIQKNTLDDFEVRHWLDSYQLVSYLPKNARILDIGSGAGFPGLVLAMAGFHVTLCEINQKKMTFLKEVSRQCHLENISFFEDAYNYKKEAVDVITSRAFADLSVLLSILESVSRETKSSRSPFGLFLKGRTYKEEISEARKKYNFDVEIYPSQTSKESAILKITNLKPY